MSPRCSAVLAHYLLAEKLNAFGVLGCVLCISGSLAIVLHAPEERPIASVLQVWGLAMQPCESRQAGAGLQQAVCRVLRSCRAPAATLRHVPLCTSFLTLARHPLQGSCCTAVLRWPPRPI